MVMIATVQTVNSVRQGKGGYTVDLNNDIMLFKCKFNDMERPQDKVIPVSMYVRKKH